MDRVPPGGATWAEVALALVEFAREDTWRFILVAGVLTFMWKALRILVVLKARRNYSRRRDAEIRTLSSKESDSDD